MRICLYSEKVPPGQGGQEVVIDRLARGLCDAGHSVVVLAPRGRNASDHRDAEYPYPIVRHPRIRSTRWFVAAFGRWLTKLHRRYRFELVHCHSVHPTGYIAVRCAALAEVPLVISSHGGDIDDASPLYRKPALVPHYRVALCRADVLVAVSRFIESRLQQWCDTPTRIERIPHGVDTACYATAVKRPSELPSPVRPGRYFLYLGRIVRRKGGDLLLDAFRRLAADSDAYLVIAGSGSAENVVKAAVAESESSERIVMLPWVEGDTKTWLLQNSRCLVMPSRHSEAFGLTALESFAAARPVIASDIPGLDELVVDEHNGIVVAPESADELAVAMQTALDRPELLDRLGQTACEDAQAFTWEKTIARHLALYHEIIDVSRATRTR